MALENVRFNKAIRNGEGLKGKYWLSLKTLGRGNSVSFRKVYFTLMGPKVNRRKPRQRVNRRLPLSQYRKEIEHHSPFLERVGLINIEIMLHRTENRKFLLSRSRSKSDHINNCR